MSAEIIAYKYLNIPAFSHFLYRGCECMLSEDGKLLVRNEECGEWIRLNRPEFQTEYCIAHPEEVSSLAAVNWHPDPYLDADETWEIYQKSLRGLGPDSRVG